MQYTMHICLFTQNKYMQWTFQCGGLVFLLLCFSITQSIMQALQYWQALQDMSMHNKLVTDASSLLLHIP